MKLLKRAQWGFDGWRHTPARLRRSAITHLTVHFDGDRPVLSATGPAMVRNIHAFHKNTRRWSGIGYNFVIDAQGVVYEARGLDYQGAHKPSGPGNNPVGVGVQFHLGGHEEPTEAMKLAFVELKAWTEAQVGRPLKTSWHNEGYATGCPGPKLVAWVKAGLPLSLVAGAKATVKTAPAKATTAIKSAISTRQGSVAGEPRGPFPLAKGHYYGPNDGTVYSHSGFAKQDRGAVKAIQLKVGVQADGVYGEATRAAVRLWQELAGLKADGLVGAQTWAAM